MSFTRLQKSFLPPETHPIEALRSQLSAFFLLITCIAVLIDQLSGGIPWLSYLTVISAPLYILLEWTRNAMMARTLVLLTVTLLTSAWFFMEDPLKLLVDSISLGAFFMAFFCALSFIRGAAENSDQIRRAGLHLLAQPSAWRYLALTFGANLFGLIISFGSLNLLGSMVLRAEDEVTKGKSDPVSEARTRRAILAILRGFSMVPAWSPLSIAVPMVLLSQPGLSWQALVPWALLVAIGLMLLGWVEDKLQPPLPMPPGGFISTTERWSIHAPLLILILLIFALAITVENTLQTRLVVGVMLVCPLIATGWMLLQALSATENRRSRFARTLGRHVMVTMPGCRVELTVLFTAACIGVFVQHALPPGLITQLLEQLNISAYWLPPIAFLTIVFLTHFAINPMMSTFILSNAIPAGDELGISQISLALAYLSGWGVGVASSPFTISNLVMAGLTGKPSNLIAYQWNLRYTLVATLVMSFVLYAAA